MTEQYKTVRYAVRPASTIRNWEVWDILLEVKDGGSREIWGKKVGTFSSKKIALNTADELNAAIRTSRGI